MTLQQKLLAKQSKKGFTLVELVVVIAILAILAAIAIPAVIGIINSATESAGESDASTLNNGCKTVYSGVKSGTITNSDKDNNGDTCSWAASKGASSSVRTAAAKAVKVADVQKYNGTSISYDDLWYATTDHTDVHVSKGTIVFYDGTGDKPSSADKALTATTSMKDLYGNEA
ncbi:MAG: prepilin-type N-terminal cleavage/methylation domain-containing protein [Clostridia bacterium]|nr:prepilin-type N-terminal cleavage/methylation domain-containing protein [Clostridia bacterium]